MDVVGPLGARVEAGGQFARLDQDLVHVLNRLLGEQCAETEFDSVLERLAPEL